MLEVLSFCDRERAQSASIKVTELTSGEKKKKKKYNEAFRGVYFLRRRKKCFSQISSS